MHTNKLGFQIDIIATSKEPLTSMYASQKRETTLPLSSDLRDIRKAKNTPAQHQLKGVSELSWEAEFGKAELEK